jgi:hypothetical protein
MSSVDRFDLMGITETGQQRFLTSSNNKQRIEVAEKGVEMRFAPRQYFWRNSHPNNKIIDCH